VARKPSRVYTARWRARERAGRCLLKVEVDEVAVTLALIDRKLISPLRADDRAELSRAAGRALELFCSGETSRVDDRNRAMLALALRALRKKARTQPRRAG
jgi:hypothetical protein